MRLDEVSRVCNISEETIRLLEISDLITISKNQNGEFSLNVNDCEKIRTIMSCLGLLASDLI